MMCEVAERVDEGALPAGLGLRKTRHRKHRGRGKGSCPVAGSVADGGGVFPAATIRAAELGGTMLSGQSGTDIMR